MSNFWVPNTSSLYWNKALWQARRRSSFGLLGWWWERREEERQDTSNFLVQVSWQLQLHNQFLLLLDQECQELHPSPFPPPQHGRKVLPNALPSLARDSCSPGITDHSSWPPKLIEITKRPDKKFRQGFIGTPVGEREWEQATGSLVPSLVWGGRGWAASFYG